MKLFIILSIYSLYPLTTFSQIKDTTHPCLCSYSYKIKYPKAAEENNVSGKVTVEMDVNDSCLLSNPVVIKGIGYGCDEEALRIVKQMILYKNKCVIKCKETGCTKQKIRQTINFERAEE
jgi:outer membrane biosynthesis protein TonB